MTFIPREPPKYLEGQEAEDYLDSLERSYSRDGDFNINNPLWLNFKERYLLQKRAELKNTGRIQVPTARDIWERANKLISLVDQIKFE